MRRLYLLLGMIIITLFYGAFGIDAQAAHAEEYGIIRKQTRLYLAPAPNAPNAGEIGKNERVEVISILPDYLIIRYKGCYAYISKQDIRIDNKFEEYLGRASESDNFYDFILTDGEIYQSSLQKLVDAYLEIPSHIRERFEREGFLIIMTGKDITKPAYAPYGGYFGIGKIKSVFDYERRLLFVNDEWPTAVIHEMGHYVNDVLDGFSGRTENKEIFATEASKISQYAMSNDREYFAEAFRLYITEPKLLAVISEESYSLVEQAVKKWNKKIRTKYRRGNL